MKRFYLCIFFLCLIINVSLADGPKEDAPVLWQQKLGAGDGAVAVAAGKVYSLGLFAPDGQSLLPERQKSPEAAEVLLCIDMKDGREIWRKVIAKGTVKKGKAWEYEHSVPQVLEGRVYVRGCWGTLACLDAQSGETVWLRTPEELGALAMDFGYQASALVEAGRVFSLIATDVAGKGAELAAFSAADGKELWRRDLETERHAKWSPPTLAVLNGELTLIMSFQNWVLGLNPADGTERWSYNLLKQGQIPHDSKIAREGRVGMPGHTHEDEVPPAVVGNIVVGELRRFHKRGGNNARSDYFGLKIAGTGPEWLWHQEKFVNFWDSQAV